MGVIQRLLSRATGTAAPGLRPRLPGRFETTAGASQGLAEQPSETVSQHPRAPVSEPTRNESVATSPQATAETPAPPPLADTARPAPGADAAEGATPVRREARRETGSTPQVEPVAPPAVAPPAVVPPAVVAQAAAEVSPHKAEVPAPHPAPLDAVRNAPRSRVQRPSRRRRSPPEPLLGRADPVSPLAAAPTTPWPDPLAGQPGTPAAPVPPAAAAEPDIHIHIGRIELRADSPETPKPKQPARERRIASLDDYLKGGKA